jgi:hypothetical protein
LQLRTGSTILQHEGDTLIYDLKPNMDFKNFTGTSINLPNVESINESGIDGHPGPGYITW